MVNVNPEKSVAYTWGSTPQERLISFPCDGYIESADEAYFRAIDVQTPAPVLFRWLCQLKLGSYSYDWLDHLERIFFRVADSIPVHPSPEQLLPGVDNLAVGQKFMGILQLVEFEPNRQITIVMDDEQAISIFGDIAASYVIFPVTPNACRLVLKGNIRYPKSFFWSWIPYVLPWGDLLMMRQQFLRLKHLAESSV
ncbi:hypothetical protein IQ243_23960 [Nostocales cyanobacterium LEGE 11386]|nr:hypothetical protein [Nostocales cyanobacterium LEGE 11386]